MQMDKPTNVPICDTNDPPLGPPTGVLGPQLYPRLVINLNYSKLFLILDVSKILVCVVLNTSI